MKKILCLVFVLTLFVFNGCASVTPLTDEEEDTIAYYSANLVSKYNARQKNGVAFVSPSSEFEVIKREEDRKRVLEENSGGSQPEQDESSDGQGTGDGTDSENPDGQTATVDEPQGEPTYKETTLSELLSDTGLRYSVTAARTADHYTIDGVMDLSPGNGKLFLVLTITATNPAGEDITADLSSKNIRYSCAIGTTSVYSSGSGFVPNEFTSWSGTVAAGGAQDFLLFFPFPSDVLSSGDSQSFLLRAEQDDVVYRITE